MISKKTLNEIVDRLVKEIHPNKIYLFGSFAWGVPTEDSDLDLMIIVDNSPLKTIDRVMKARKALWGIHVSKDILVKTKDEFEKYAKMQSSLEAEILKNGKLLYEQ